MCGRTKWCLIYTLLFLITPLFAKGWQTAFHCAFLFSDNVFESVDETRADGGTRLMWILRPPVLQHKKKLWLSAQYQGGFEGYGNYAAENRWIHQVTGHSGWQFAKRFRLMWQGHLRQRNFLSSNHQFTRIQQNTGLIFNPGAGISAGIKTKNLQLKVKDNPVFDHQGNGAHFFIKWQINRNAAVKPFAEYLNLTYSRDAYAQVDTLNFQPTARAQEDQLSRIGFQLEFYVDVFIRLGMLYEINRSNSFGFDYHKPQLHFLAARSLTRGWTFSLFLKFSWKKYKDPFAPFWPVSPDTEIEENNMIWTTLSKDISPHVLWKTQWGWYRNESPFRDRYYSKHFILTGFSLHN